MQLKLSASLIPADAPMRTTNSGEVKYFLFDSWQGCAAGSIDNVLLRWWIQIGIWTVKQDSSPFLALTLPKMFNDWLSYTADQRARELYSALMNQAISNSMLDDEFYAKLGFAPGDAFPNLKQSP
jgi:hypothetical protein